MKEIISEVKPFWKVTKFFDEVTSRYGTLAVTPSFELLVWKKDDRNPKRYFEGAYEERVHLVFKFLKWEAGLIIARRNYRSSITN